LKGDLMRKLAICFILLFVSFPAFSWYPDLPSAMNAIGYTHAAAQGINTGPVDLSVAITDPHGPDAAKQHFGRYKFWQACANGSPCGSGGCGGEQLFGQLWAVEAVIRHPSNPLNLVGNLSYVVTIQDFMDIERFTLAGGGCDAGVFRAYFLPMAKTLGIIAPEPPVDPPIDPPSCSNATTLCLNKAEFKVTMSWVTPAGERRQAKALPFRLDTGFFYYDQDDNLELMIKVLDGCGVNGHYWVFMAAATDMAYRVNVEDRMGNHRSYLNPGGELPRAVGDTSAFVCE